MNRPERCWAPTFPLAVCLLLAIPGEAAQAQEDGTDLEARVAELENKLEVMGQELEHLDLGGLVPAVGESEHGLGPAASKVYGVEQGLSIGGYGEAIYQAFPGDAKSDRFDFLRAVLYFGYKFDESWVFNSEIEFEHASTGKSGEVGVEFAYLDYLLSRRVNGRAGLVLVPMGFINELHEPTTFLTANRPQTESLIIPTTWRETGLGFFGEVGPLSYKAFLVNGFDATGFSASGLRGGRQKGSKALAEDLAVVARVDWTDTPGLLVGGSLYQGGAGQGQVGLGDTTTTIYELHAEVQSGGLYARGLYAAARVDDVAPLNASLGLAGAASVGEQLHGAYVEAGFDVMAWLDPESEMSLSPYGRWETFDTQAEVPSGFASDPAKDDEVLTFGIQFKPLDQIVFKLDFDDFEEGTDRLSLAMGYIF